MIIALCIIVTAGSLFGMKIFRDKANFHKSEHDRAMAELANVAPIIDLNRQTRELSEQKAELAAAIENLERKLEFYGSEFEVKEMNFYKARYEFEDIAQYKQALDLIESSQKVMIKEKLVFALIDGGLPKGKALQNVGRLAVNAFNGEAGPILEAVSWNNFEQSKEKLRTIYNRINTLLEPSGLIISAQYLDLKVKEMAIAYDYEQAQQKLKEEQISLKEQMREEESAREEAEEAREAAIEKVEMYEKALATAQADLAQASAEERAKFEAEIAKLKQEAADAKVEKERAISNAQITKRGFVYVISNVGSFGENIFKIGMTRRKDPKDRVIELSDASVPFSFDIHGMIEAEDAPAIENALHRQFTGRRVNKINERKEFFRVTIQDIQKACSDMGLKVDLSLLAEARDYKATMEMDSKKSAA